MTKTAKRRMGLAYLGDAESWAVRAQAEMITHPHMAMTTLCHAHNLLARGNMLIDPINPQEEAALLREQRRVSNFVHAVTTKLEKRIRSCR